MDDQGKTYLFPFVGSFRFGHLYLAKFVREIVERVVSADAIGGDIKVRRVSDVETANFKCKGVHRRWLEFEKEAWIQSAEV